MHRFYLTLIKNAKSELMRLSLLGLISGIAAAFTIIIFRLLIEHVQRMILPDNNSENYESLASWAILTLPLLGGIILGAIFHYISPDKRQVGVVHTLEVMQERHSRLPLFNTLVQFFGAAVSIICGHSVGREGPSIHLGASSGSLVAGLMHTSEGNTRIMLASGVAAAIAASFNTPMAGVIFAIEVILARYTVATLMPIIIAAAVATMMSHFIFGSDSTLHAPNIINFSAGDYLGAVINGIIIGLLAVIFIRLLLHTTKITKEFPIFWRLSVAGGITGVLALMAPEIMSIGYDTINATFHNSLLLVPLIIILVLKIVATAISLGLGLPGGLIGPTLVIGAVCGGAFGTILNELFSSNTSPAIYAMIGMGAMMSATLQAPLAALMAIFELTHNPEIILPGMLAIAAASLTSGEILKQPSVFFALMHAREIKQEVDDNEESPQPPKQL